MLWNSVYYYLLFMCGYIVILSQQKIDILGNAGKEQEIKLSEVAKSVRVIPLETTEECLLGTDLKIYYGEEYILYVIKDNRELFIASQRMESFLIR